MAGEHETIPIQVWADVDKGIAPLVQYLNTIPGVRTHASCQGTIGEGGAEPYRPYVLVSYWTEEAEMRLRKEFDCEEVFMSTARIHPRDGWVAPDDEKTKWLSSQEAMIAHSTDTRDGWESGPCTACGGVGGHQESCTGSAHDE